MSRINDRRGTKTKVIKSGKRGQKSRYSRTWTRDGKYQITERNPKFAK